MTRFEPTPEGTASALDHVQTHLTAAGLSAKCISRCLLATDELFSNIVKYSGAAEIQLDLRIDADLVTFQLRDDGVPFDPTALPPPDLTTPAAERPIGGLGIYLVRRIMSTMRYVRIPPWNVLTITTPAEAAR